MKFKIKGDERELNITDKDGDTLQFTRFSKPSGKLQSDLYAYIVRADGASMPGVRITHGKALKLAWAIIDELDPIG